MRLGRRGGRWRDGGWRPATRSSIRSAAGAMIAGVVSPAPKASAGSSCVGVLKFSSRTRAAMVRVRAMAPRFGIVRTPCSVCEPFPMDPGIRDGEAAEGVLDALHHRSRAAQVDVTLGDIGDERRGGPARAGRGLSVPGAGGRPGSGRWHRARLASVSSSARKTRSAAAARAIQTVTSLPAAGSSSSMARSGVMPMPPAISRTPAPCSVGRRSGCRTGPRRRRGCRSRAAGAGPSRRRAP